MGNLTQIIVQTVGLRWGIKMKRIDPIEVKQAIDNKQLEILRSVYKKKYGKGIALNKLKNRLLNEKLFFIDLVNSK